MPEIEAKNIVKYFKHDKHTLKAINDISLVANSGEFVCIVGPSGCGKSTLACILCRYSPACFLEVTATISTSGWFTRSLMVSPPTYPEAPIIPTFMFSSRVWA